MILLRYYIKAPAHLVWRALTDPNEIERWSSTSATMEAKRNGRFEFWNGDVWGVNTRVKPPKLLVQRWQTRGWKSPSTVTIELQEKDNYTIVKLKQEDYPPEAEDELRTNWTEFYFYPIKELTEKENDIYET